MSMRLKFVLVIVATVVVTAVWFLASYHPTQAKVAQVRTEVTTVRAQVASLDAQLKHLQDLQRHEPQLRAKLGRFATALPSDPRLPQFILSVQDAANKAHVDFLSVTPSLPSAPAAKAGTPAGGAAPSAGLQEITVSVTTTGSYFTVQNFIYRLENLDRAIRIDTFTVSPGGAAAGGAQKLSVSLNFRMFVSKVATQAGA
jgi:Tfp pilus assembly protein PilO